MARDVWILDTETKGTGANMVPLERVQKRGSERVPGFTLPERQKPAEEAQSAKVHRFKVVDLMTRQPLAEDVDARGAVSALEPVRSLVDVSVYVRDERGDDWRRLTFGEMKALWEHRNVGSVGAADRPSVQTG